MKELLFTGRGLLVTVIHDLILIGMFSGWLFFQVEIMGNNVRVLTPVSAARK